MWDPAYLPPCLKEALTELSPPIAPLTTEKPFMLAQRKRKRSLIIPPNESTSSSKIAHKKMKFPSVSPLPESANSVLLRPLATPPSSNVSCMPPYTASEPPPAPPQMAPFLKKMSRTSKKSYPSPLSSGTQTVDLRLRTPKPPISWSDFVSYSAAISNELSFVACCSHSHNKAPLTLKTPFPSWQYPYPRILITHPLLDQVLWHPNRMLPSDVVPVVDVDTDDQQEAWGCLYTKFRASFRSQLSWCLAARHDLLTRHLHSDLIAIREPTTSVTFRLICTCLVFDFALTRRPVSLSRD